MISNRDSDFWSAVCIAALAAMFFVMLCFSIAADCVKYNVFELGGIQIGTKQEISR